MFNKQAIIRTDKYIHIYLVADKRGNFAAPSLATYVYPSSTVVKTHI